MVKNVALEYASHSNSVRRVIPGTNVREDMLVSLPVVIVSAGV